MNIPVSLLNAVRESEAARAGSGALLGILLAGAGSNLAFGTAGAIPLLMAPLGASAVLLFAVPASPLAQPWPALGGNFISALVGVTVALSIANPLLAAAVAVGAAILIMSLLGCLHPPGGAVALTAAMIAAESGEIGYSFAISPVLFNTALLVVGAAIFHRLNGRTYPHRAHEPLHAHPSARERWSSMRMIMTGFLPTTEKRSTSAAKIWRCSTWSSPVAPSCGPPRLSPQKSYRSRREARPS